MTAYSWEGCNILTAARMIPVGTDRKHKGRSDNDFLLSGELRSHITAATREPRREKLIKSCVTTGKGSSISKSPTGSAGLRLNTMPNSHRQRRITWETDSLINGAVVDDGWWLMLRIRIHAEKTCSDRLLT
jgi:hypothetical protein